MAASDGPVPESAHRRDPSIVRRTTSPVQWTVRWAVGLAVGALLVWLLFRDTEWAAVAETLRGVHWGWLALSHAVQWLSLFTRVQRWSYVVAAVRPTRFRTLLTAAQLGTLANLVLPLRLGDAVRLFVLARLGRFRLAQAAAMVALDRLGEVTGLVSVFVIALIGFPMDRDLTLPPGAVGNSDPVVFSSRLLRSGVTTSALALVAAVVVLTWLSMHRDRWAARGSGSAAPRGLLGIVLSFSEGLHVLRSGGALARSTFFTVLSYLLNALSLAWLLSAFGLEFPWYSPFTVLVALAVFIAAPLTPGLIGQFHLPIVAALLLTAPAVSLSEALAVALVAHVQTLIPIVALGGYCFATAGLRWRQLMTAADPVEPARRPRGR